MIDRRKHGGHGLNRWQVQVEALHAGAGLCRSKLADAITQVKGAIVAVGDGGGVASAASVVKMIAGFVGHRSPRTVSSFKFRVSSERQNTSWRSPGHSLQFRKYGERKEEVEKIRYRDVTKVTGFFPVLGKGVSPRRTRRARRKKTENDADFADSSFVSGKCRCETGHPATITGCATVDSNYRLS